MCSSFFTLPPVAACSRSMGSCGASQGGCEGCRRSGAEQRVCVRVCVRVQLLSTNAVGTKCSAEQTHSLTGGSPVQRARQPLNTLPRFTWRRNERVIERVNDPGRGPWVWWRTSGEPGHLEISRSPSQCLESTRDLGDM